MKFREQAKLRERGSKAQAVLSPELPPEPTLNEQIGLSPQLEEHFLDILRVETDRTDILVRQVEIALYLTSLLPQKVEQLKQLAPVDKLLSTLSPDDTSNERIFTWYTISFFAPKRLPQYPPHIEESRLRTIKTSINDPLVLAYSAEALRLFPERALEIKDLLKETIEEFTLDPSDPQSFLEQAYSLLQLKPELHPKLHALTLKHRERLGSFLSQKKARQLKLKPTVGWVTAHLDARQLMTLKLLLAEDIQVMPTGIMAAVEKPVLHKARPLPDRSLAV